MEKAEHGELLRTAMARAALERTTVADAAKVSPRTVTNWTTGKTMPSATERESLRRLLGPYDEGGDQVELAVRQSRLAGFRQTKVIGFYQEQLHEQDREERGSA